MTVEKLIKDVSFPVSGDYFATVFIDKIVERAGPHGSIVAERIIDRSYQDQIMQCLSSDATRVVARVVHGYDNPSKPIHIFLREEWRMDNVDHLLPSLGIAIPESKAR